MNNWSLFDVQNFFKLTNFNYTTEGYGYVYEQSVAKDTVLTNDITVNLKLKDKFFDKPENENTE